MLVWEKRAPVIHTECVGFDWGSSFAK
jgi:hypothetical protein